MVRRENKYVDAKIINAEKPIDNFGKRQTYEQRRHVTPVLNNSLPPIAQLL